MLGERFVVTDGMHRGLIIEKTPVEEFEKVKDMGFFVGVFLVGKIFLKWGFLVGKT